MSSSAASAPTHRAEPPKEKRVFRTDVHGLRGLAVFLVVIYHVFVGRVSGGVDVFLFISAYFLTGTFVRRMETGKPIAAVGYWGRTFKRLLPPTVVVTFAILAATYLFLPASTYVPMLKDAFFTLIQGENWWLINQATDYYAADRTAASPFQHFWSLSIQGQVFLAWPLLFALLALGLKAFERRFPPKSQHQHNIRAWSTSGIAIGAVTLASFIWSVIETAADQQTAYFDTFARFWEFGLGGLVAIALPLIAERTDTLHPSSPKGRSWRFALSMVGVLALVSMGMLVDVAGKFPGWLAIWPLAAAAFVMVMGYNPILSSKPLQKLGGISYGLYLAHWPLLVLTLQILDIPKAPFWLGVVLVIASLALAWLLTKFVDTPFRRWKWAGAKTHRSVAVALVTVAVGLVPVIGAQQYLEYRTEQVRAEAYKNNPGARVLDESFAEHPDADPSAPELPGPTGLENDWWYPSGSCDDIIAHNKALKAFDDTCTAIIRGDLDRKNTVIYFGNSHIRQVASAFEPLLDEAGLNTIALIRHTCSPFIDKSDYWCNVYANESLKFIKAMKPKAVIMDTTMIDRENVEHTDPEMLKVVNELTDEGIEVIALRDQAHLASDLNQCRDANPNAPEECIDRSWQKLPAERPDQELADNPRVHFVDFNPSICPDGECVPAIGNVTVFLDVDHITKSYAESLQDVAQKQLEESGFSF